MISTLTRKPLKYGILNDTDMLSRIPAVPLKASEVFVNQSGKFVSNDTGAADVSVAGDTQILGWANVSAGTVGTGEYAEVYNDPSGRFCIGATSGDLPSATEKLGYTCDLEVNTNVQTANTDASSTDVIVVYDTNTEFNLCEVGLNPIKLYTAGVS
jgi:hypothetical protein